MMIFRLSSMAQSLNQRGFTKRLAQTFACVVMLTFMTSCANDPAHKTAMEQAKKGPVEEGIAKLKQSSQDHPESVPYKGDYLRERDRVVNELLIDAARALGQENTAQAETTYQRVLAIDPDNMQAKLGLDQVARINKHSDAISSAREAMERGDFAVARNTLQPVLIEDPNNKEAVALRHEIDDARYKGRLSDPLPELGKNFKKPVSMQFRDANLKMILEALARSSGLNILVDKDVKNDLKATIFVKDASVQDVLSLLLMQNQLEKKIVNDTTVYIYPNTPAKTKEFQDLVIRDFHLVNADAKQMLAMLKTVLKSNDIFINESNNSIVMRDTPDVVELATKLIAAQDQSEPEVMLEVEVLEVSHNKLMELGIKYPDQVTFSVGAAAAAATTTATGTSGGLTLRDLKNLNDSKINVFSSAGAFNLVLDLKKTDGASNLLANPRIRVKQNEKAKIHIGEKVPVITNSVTPVSTGTPVVTGSVQYLDVGLKLEVEPQIHMDDEVSIKTGLEVSNINSQVTNSASGTIAYQIGTRNVSTVLRLKNGETQVLAGLISDNDIKSASKIPGLGDLPILGRLFSSHNTNNTKSEIILTITPHIIRNQHQPDADLSLYWSGTTNAAKSRPITVDKVEAIKMENVGGGNAQSDAFSSIGVLPQSVPASPSVGAPILPNVPAVAPAQPTTPATTIKPRPGAAITPLPRGGVTGITTTPVSPSATQGATGAAGMTDATLPATSQ